MWQTIGPVTTYGILYNLSFVIHAVVGLCVAPRLNLRRRWAVALTGLYVLGMLPGAKFLYNWRTVGFDPFVVFDVDAYIQGGLWGGMLVYLFLVILLAGFAAGHRRELLDLSVITISPSWAIAKTGCFLNGCCYGRPCSLPWGVTFPETCTAAPTGEALHPTQVYEIILVLVLWWLLLRLNNERWRGLLLFWFIFVYGLGRAGIDLFRGDGKLSTYVGPLTLTQLVCLLSAATAVLILLRARNSWS
ncbi:MAG: prolipoprotein diacylglyceryl transferase [Pontiellaceae bacterium]|nr:prolipoprotein diacylglyceryl transferase [Pontiellaceae bacterium]